LGEIGPDASFASPQLQASRAVADIKTGNAAFLADRAERIRMLGKRIVGDIIEIGRLLAECKERCGHGNWLPWLDREFGWSSDKAEDYIAIAARWPNSDDCPNLPMYSLRLLTAPSTPESAYTEVIERSGAGEQIKHAEIQAIIAAHGKGSIIRAATILRAERIEERRAERLKRIAAQCDPGPLPKGPWPLIFADPPWRYTFSPTDSHSIERHYETMTLEEICALRPMRCCFCVCRRQFSNRRLM
jgi:hypothetical protein